MRHDRYRTLIVPPLRISSIKISAPAGRLPLMYHIFRPAVGWAVNLTADPLSAENISRMRALGRQTSRLTELTVAFRVVDRVQALRIREFMFANLNKDPANPAYTR